MGNLKIVDMERWNGRWSDHPHDGQNGFNIVVSAPIGNIEIPELPEHN